MCTDSRKGVIFTNQNSKDGAVMWTSLGGSLSVGIEINPMSHGVWPVLLSKKLSRVHFLEDMGFG